MIGIDTNVCANRSNPTGALKAIAILNEYIVMQRRTMARLFEILGADPNDTYNVRKVNDLIAKFGIPLEMRDSVALFRFIDKKNVR